MLDAGFHVRIAGEEGVVLFRVNGTTWSAPKSQSSDRLENVSFQAGGHGFIFGRQSTVIEYE